MFGLKFVVCVVLCTWVNGHPLDLDDVQIVESTIREVRAVPPKDLAPAGTGYNYDQGSDDGDSVGYLKRTEDGGSDGYKHFDSYHKKDGDNYGYEKHTSFGKAFNSDYDSGDASSASSPEGGQSESYKTSEEQNEGGGYEGYGNEGYTNEGEPAQYNEGVGSAEGYNTGGENAQYTGEQTAYTDGTYANYEQNADFGGQSADFEGQNAAYAEQGAGIEGKGAEGTDY